MRQNDTRPDIKEHFCKVNTASTCSEKASLRLSLKERRRALPPGTRAEYDRLICENICGSPFFRGADALLLYRAFGSEADLSAAADKAHALGIICAYPRTDRETHTIRFFDVCDSAELLRGAYGIEEPPACAAERIPTRRTLLIAPALAAGRDGYRLGYGGGYYDRYLSSFPGISFCAVYDGFVFPQLPHGEYDMKTGFLVSQSGIYEAAARE